MTNAQEALKELMEKYNEFRAKWLSFYGNDNGFNEWFTVQVVGEEKAAEISRVNQKQGRL